MIRWCSFCQRYIGEKEPFEDYGITHGMCEKCGETAGSLNKAFFQKTNTVIEYFRKLKEYVSLGSPIEVEKIIKEGLELGVKPEDIAIGMIQPLLYEIAKCGRPGG